MHLPGLAVAFARPVVYCATSAMRISQSCSFEQADRCHGVTQASRAAPAGPARGAPGRGKPAPTATQAQVRRRVFDYGKVSVNMPGRRAGRDVARTGQHDELADDGGAVRDGSIGTHDDEVGRDRSGGCGRRKEEE